MGLLGMWRQKGVGPIATVSMVYTTWCRAHPEYTRCSWGRVQGHPECGALRWKSAGSDKSSARNPHPYPYLYSLAADWSCADLPGHIPALGSLGLLWNCAEQAVGSGRDPALPGTRHLHPLLDGLPGHQSTQAMPAGNGNGHVRPTSVPS